MALAFTWLTPDFATAGQLSAVTSSPWESRTRAVMTKTIAATASTPTTTSARTRAKLMGLAPDRVTRQAGTRDLSRG